MKLAPYGYFFELGDEQHRRAFPKMIFSTRHGLETLLRRLVIGDRSMRYPNIQQIVGTVTGVIVSEDSGSDSGARVGDGTGMPGGLRGVSVRTEDGEKTIDAALVIGEWCAGDCVRAS
jgi:hypothetical protein